MPDPIATLAPTGMRRLLSTAAIFALAVVLFYSAATQDGAGVLPRAGLVLGGLACLALALASRRAGQLALELYEDGLFDSHGRLVARLADIASVDRGSFAFKPSNGFAIHLKRPGGPAWAPGLYWRYGTRVGVGGALRAAEARAFADRITLLLIEQPGGADDDRPQPTP